MLLACAVACARAPEPEAAALTARELPVRVAVQGPRFARLDPGAIGLRFENTLRRENVVAYVYMGAGLAVGDYDQDGLPDVYLVSQDGPNKLFRQVAPLRFEDVTESAGGLGGGDAWGTAATFADVDGDGDLDLYVCNLESPNLLYQNRGDGTFVEKAGAFGLAHTGASTGAAFADYDNDGDLDLYLLTNRVFRPTLADEIVAETTPPGAVRKPKRDLLAPDLTFTYEGRRFMAGQRDLLFRNDGYAKFVDATDAAGLDDHGNGLSVVWWDFDDDGFLDLYVANDFQSPDLLWRNRGDGTFEDVTARLPHTAFFGMGCDFADVDGDGRFDLCVADMSSTTHYMGKMLMGSMDQHRWFLMNADPQQYMRNALYVNTGTERFLEAAHLAGLASTDWTWAVLFGDLDEDGRPDLFVTNGIPVFADNPDIGERVERLWAERRYDEALDVLRTIPRVDEKNIARRNLGGLSFADVGAEWGLDEPGVTHGAVLVDLDRDGDLDIVTNNLNAGASVFENRSAGGHRLLVELRAAGGNRFGVGARLTVEAGGRRQVRLVSPTRGYMSAGEPVEHFGLGDATRVDRLTVRWPSGREQTWTDVDADVHLTLREDEASPVVPPPSAEATAAPTFAARALPARHEEREFDDYAVQPLLPHRLSRLGPGVAAGDVDGDGRCDLWFGGAAGQPGTLLRASEGGAFTPVAGPWAQHAASEDLGAVFVDFDGDGDLDLYVVSGGVEAGKDAELLRDRVYVNDGRGGFAPAPDGVVPDLRDSGSCVAAADFDRDGDLDLFVGGRAVPGRFPHAAASRLLRNDGGRFVDVTADLASGLTAAGMVAGACWSDVDGDGFADLVVAAQWQPLRVFRNAGGERLDDATDALGLAGLHGQWNGVAAADLDGDGDVDLVATNLGLNTKYKASPEKPLELFARDFDGNGTMDVVEAKHQGDATLPVRGLSCSSQAMPFVRERFPTYDAFARASLGDIYGEALDDCLQLACHELRHVVFEQRDGRFVARPLPRLAQVSAAFGVAVADFDADGHQDLVLAHNFFSPEPETGRFDGGLGLWLRGTGGLEFAPVSARDSGIVLPTDQKALVTADLDGDGRPGFVVASNDGVARAFGTRAPAQLAVRLAGPAGNPTGIGARVELRRAGAAVAAREVHAGSGYLSQSQPVVWFAGIAADDVLVVRWPDGGETTHELTATTGAVTLRR